MNVKKLFQVVWAGGFALLPAKTVFAAASYTLVNGDQDVTILNDLDPYFGSLAVGDFNGDGRCDIAMTISVGVGIVLGKSNGWPAEMKLNGAFDTILKNFGRDLYAGDINGDGKDDLVSGISIPPGEIQVVFGRESFPGIIDFLATPVDLRIIGKSDLVIARSVDLCDVNGDGRKDILSGTSNGTVLLFSKATYPSPTINLSVTAPDVRFSGTYLSGFDIGPISGRGADFNGDGKDDVHFSLPFADPLGRTDAGEIDIIYGSTALPTVWNLDTRAPDVRLVGPGPSSRLERNSYGDATGDGKADLTISPGGVLISGADISTVGPVGEIVPGYPHSLTTEKVPLQATLFTGDMDGDGRSEMVSAQNSGGNGSFLLKAYLSSEAQVGVVADTAAFTISSYDSMTTLLGHDLNNDGNKDLILMGDVALPPPSGVFYSAIYVFYGYKPLKNPQLSVMATQPGSRWVILSLGVDGPAAEMRFTGDITEPPPGTWVPYQPSQTVTVTPTAGSKTVTVTYRNSFRRESDPVSATYSLDVNVRRLLAVTNKIRSGTKAVFEVQMPAPGRVVARVYAPGGGEVRTLYEDDAPSGVMTLEWDGTNSKGQRVAPGAYVLSVSLDGSMERGNIVVE